MISAFTWHHRHRSGVARYLDTAHHLIPELREPFALERIATPMLLICELLLGFSPQPSAAAA